MEFKRLRIMEAGPTANSWYDEDDEPHLISISEEALEDLVRLGNLKPIHCRRTHNGNDLLDGYLGKFVNFVKEGPVVYADLIISEALMESYPNEAKFITSMIENEPDMLGVSIVGANDFEDNEDDNGVTVTGFSDFWSADLVGLPAATSSLFSNNKIKKRMNKFFSRFAEAFKPKTIKMATQTIQVVDGSEITVETELEELAVGDKVYDSDGNIHPDGEVQIEVDDMVAIMVIEDGVVKEIKPVEDEPETEPETTAAVPEEFATRVEALEASITELRNEFKAAFSTMTKAPAAQGAGTPKGKGTTKLSKEAVAAAAAKFYGK